MGSLKSKNFLISTLFIFFLMPRMVTSQSNNDIATGIQLFDAKKFSEAKQFFASYAKNNAKDPVAAYYQGRLFLREGNYDQAIDWLEQAIKLDETNSDYHFWLGRAYVVKAQRAGMLKKASAAKNIKKSFERAVELNPANLDARMGLVQFYAFAPGIMGGSKDKARDQAKAISQQNVHQGYLAFGLIHVMNQQFDEAEQAYQSAIKANPDDFQAYFSLGYLYAQKKQYDEAIALFENVLQSHPDLVAAHFHLGRLAVMSGKNLDKGEENLKKYLQTEPSDERPSFAFAHLLLGHIYRMQDKKDLARIEYENALKLDPEFEQAKKAVGDL